MRRHVIIGTFLAAFVAGCGGPSAPLPPIAQPHRGDEYGNGGDPLAKLFEAGRGRAVQIVRSIDKILPEDVPGPEAQAAIHAIRLYGERRQALLDDIQNTPAYRWVRANRNGACGSTVSRARAPVYLSYIDCRGIRNEIDAAIHLVGESVHHLGFAEDAFAGFFSVMVKNAWLRDRREKSGFSENETYIREARDSLMVWFRHLKRVGEAGLDASQLGKGQSRWLIEHREALIDELVLVTKDPLDEIVKPLSVCRRASVAISEVRPSFCASTATQTQFAAKKVLERVLEKFADFTAAQSEALAEAVVGSWRTVVSRR